MYAYIYSSRWLITVHLQKKDIQAQNKGTTMKVRMSMLHYYVSGNRGVVAETLVMSTEQESIFCQEMDVLGDNLEGKSGTFTSLCEWIYL